MMDQRKPLGNTEILYAIVAYHYTSGQINHYIVPAVSATGSPAYANKLPGLLLLF